MRSPPVSGLGCWIWSLTTPNFLFPAFQHSVGVLLYRQTVKELRATIPFLGEESFRDSLCVQLAVLFSFVIASRVAGLPGAPAPDAREWAGGAYAILQIAWWAYSGKILR
jgi:hypothetical protein